MGLALAGCSSGDPSSQEGSAPASAHLAQKALIACAVNGATKLESQCAVDRQTTGSGVMLTLRHPDGGFRRLLVVADGRGLITADGAERAVLRPVAAKLVDVAITGDVYRIPATVKP